MMDDETRRRKDREHVEVYRALNTPTDAALLRQLIEDPSQVFPLPMHASLARLGYAEPCTGGWRLMAQEQRFLKERGHVRSE